MRKAILMVLAISMPMGAMASISKPFLSIPSQNAIPSKFLGSGETTTLEWGCPIENEQVEADNQKSALNQLVSQCLEQVSRAAELKPEVAAVLRASVIAPSLTIKEETKGIHRVNGTIFLETLVSLVISPK